MSRSSRSSRSGSASETPDEYRGLHRVLLGLATFFFVYLIVEGMILVPLLFTRYGLH